MSDLRDEVAAALRRSYEDDGPMDTMDVDAADAAIPVVVEAIAQRLEKPGMGWMEDQEYADLVRREFGASS